MRVCKTVLKKVTCFVETKMVLTFPQSLRWVDTGVKVTISLLVSPSVSSALKSRPQVEPVGTLVCNFFISFSLFYNMKTPRRLILKNW